MRRKIPPHMGLKLLAVWLVLSGLTTLVDLHFEGLGLIMGVLAIVAGVLIVIER